MQAPPISILGLHGFTGSGRDFEELIRNSRDWAAWYCPDLPGHGQRPARPDSPLLEQSLDVVEQAWTQLDPAGLRIALGYSLGGRLWLQMLRNRPLPCDALILIGSHPGIIDEVDRQKRREWDAGWIKVLETQGTAAFLGRWKQQPLLQSQEKKISPPLHKAMREAAVGLDQHTLMRIIRDLSPAVLEPLEDWGALNPLPVLLVAGETDEKYASLYRDLAKGSAHHQLLLIPGVGHAAHLEAPQDFLQGLKTFIQNLHGPSTSPSSS